MGKGEFTFVGMAGEVHVAFVEGRENNLMADDVAAVVRMKTSDSVAGVVAEDRGDVVSKASGFAGAGG